MPFINPYEMWRISYQSSEQAARSAYREMMRLNERVHQLEAVIAEKATSAHADKQNVGYAPRTVG